MELVAKEMNSALCRAGAWSATNATTSGTSAPRERPVPNLTTANTPRLGASAAANIISEIQASATASGMRRPQRSAAQPATIEPNGMPRAVTLASRPMAAGVAPHGSYCSRLGPTVPRM